MVPGRWGWQGRGMLQRAAPYRRGTPGTEDDVCLARRQALGGPRLSAPSWRARASDRSTHPEPWPRRAAPKATGFRFPSVWKPTENKPGRQGSPRASGFLEDTTASPVSVAATGAPRESHVFGRGSRGPGVGSPGGHSQAEQERPGASRAGPLPSSTRASTGAAGARCPARGGETERVGEGSTHAPQPTKVPPRHTG